MVVHPIKAQVFCLFAGQGGEVAAHDQHPARALHPGAAGRHAAVPAPDEPLQG